MGRMRYGVHKALEAEADALIRESLAGDRSFSSKSDILTPDKEALRRRREVYVASGTPDAAIRSGNIRRQYNPARPHLNSVPSGQRASSVPNSLREHGSSDHRGDATWLEQTLGA